MNMVVTCATEDDSVKFAQKMAQLISLPFTITLSGGLGAGKTALVRAMLRASGVEGPIKSPTFSLVEYYALPDGVCNHFDLYRIADVAELEFIGFRDYFQDNALVFVEWPERCPDAVPEVDVAIEIAIAAGGGRTFTLKGLSSKGLIFIKQLAT